MYLCQFSQSLANGSEGTMQTRLFLSNMTLATLKIRSRSPDSNYFLRSPQMVYMYQFGQNLAL